MLYWLFTFNYLMPFKGYFDTELEAQEKLMDILKESVAYHKEVLHKEASNEIMLNKINETNPEFKPSNRLQLKYEDWKDFTKENLESSVVLRRIEGWEQFEIEEVLTLNYERTRTSNV